MKILLEDQDIIDFIADNPKTVKGNLVIIDEAMLNDIKSLTDEDNIKEQKIKGESKLDISIICPNTGNKTDVFITVNDRIIVNEVLADDIEPIGPLKNNYKELNFESPKNLNTNCTKPDITF